MEKDSLIRDLRSVILSCKQGVSVNQLNSDFKAFIGTDIPFRSHGYDSLEAFLKDIPDVIKLKNHNGQLIAEAIADSSTQHLSNLISKQKGSKNKASTSRKVHYKKANSNFKPKATHPPTLSNDEKDEIIRDLQSQLNQQKRSTEDYRTQLVRLNTLIKIGQTSISTEQELVNKLKLELETLKASRSQILDQLQKVHEDYRSQFSQLTSQIKTGEESLLAEKELVKKLLEKLKVAEREALKVSSNSLQTKSNSDRSSLTKELEALKAELKKEKRLKDELLAEKWYFHNKAKLDTEQELSTLLQSLLHQLKEKLFSDMVSSNSTETKSASDTNLSSQTLPVSSKRKEFNKRILTSIEALTAVLNKWTINETNPSKTTTSILNNKQIQAHLQDYFSLCDKRSQETQELRNMLLKLDQRLQGQDQKLQIQDQKLHSQGQQLQAQAQQLQSQDYKLQSHGQKLINQNKKLQDQDKTTQDLKKIFIQQTQDLTSQVQEFFMTPGIGEDIVKQLVHHLKSNGYGLPSLNTNTENPLPSTQYNSHSSFEESQPCEGKKKKKKKNKVDSNSDNPN